MLNVAISFYLFIAILCVWIRPKEDYISFKLLDNAIIEIGIIFFTRILKITSLGPIHTQYFCTQHWDKG